VLLSSALKPITPFEPGDRRIVSRGWLERLNEREKAGKYRFDPYNGASSQFDRSDGTIVLQEPHSFEKIQLEHVFLDVEDNYSLSPSANQLKLFDN
jgi:hypothetical protein